MDLQLGGKRALITGGSRGIGLAIAHGLLAESADVAIAARNPDRLAEAAAELTALGHPGRVVTAQIETGDDDSVRAAVEAVNRQLGGVDILVNSAAEPAGDTPPTIPSHTTDDEFTAAVNVKVLGYLRTSRAVLPGMIEQRWGRIISISGLAARMTGSFVATVRNVGVVALTKNLADEVGRHGITVNVVHPGNHGHGAHAGAGGRCRRPVGGRCR